MFVGKQTTLCPADRPGLERDWCQRLEQLEDRACQELQGQCGSDWERRLPRLMLRLGSVRALRASLTEELFFAGLIGSVRIDSILPYILRMEPHNMDPGGSLQMYRGQCHNVFRVERPFLLK